MLTDTQRLAELVESKHQCLTQLRALGLQQAALIGSEDMTELLRLFAGKQRLVEQLQALERHLDPYREQDPESRLWRSQAERQRCAELIAQSQGLLDEIVEQERRNEADLKQRRDRVANQLHDLQSSRDARQAYDEVPQSALLDLSS